MEEVVRNVMGNGYYKHFITLSFSFPSNIDWKKVQFVLGQDRMYCHSGDAIIFHAVILKAAYMTCVVWCGVLLLGFSRRV